jgi:hypothetical protein
MGLNSCEAKRASGAAVVTVSQFPLREPVPSFDEPLHDRRALASCLATRALPLAAQSDFLLVNVHPVFQPRFRTATDPTAAQFVVNVADQLSRLRTDPHQGDRGPHRTGECGLLGGPAGLFYKELRARLRAVVARTYFAALDAPWRAQDVTGFPARTPKRRAGGCTTARGAPSPR